MTRLLPLLLLPLVATAADPLPDGVEMRLGGPSAVCVDSRSAFSPDGKRLATIPKDGTVSVWDVATGKLLYSHPTPRKSTVRELAWTPDGRLFGVDAGSWYGALLLIGWADEKDEGLTEEAWLELSEASKAAPDAPRVHRSAVARDGRRVAVLSNGEDGRVAVFPVTLNTSTKLLKPEVTIPLPGGDFVGFSDDGSTLFTVRPSALVGDRVSAYDLTSKTPDKPVWTLELPREADREEVRDGKKVTVKGKGYPRGVRSKDGKRVVLEYPDPQGILEVWDGPKGKKLHSWTFPPHRSRYFSVEAVIALSPDGKRLAASVREKSGVVYDLDTGKDVAKLAPGPCYGTGNALRYTPDGKRLLRGHLVWDADTGEDLTPPGRGHEGYVGAVMVSGDGKTIVTAGFDYTARGWDATTGEEKWRTVFAEWDSVVRRLDGETAVITPPVGAKPSPEPLLNLTTGQRTALPGDMAKERKVKVGKETRTVQILPVAVSPDGKVAVSVDQYKPALEVWDWKKGKRRKVLPFDAPAKMRLDVIQDVAFSADGKELVGIFFYNLINPKPTIGCGGIKAHDQACLERWSIADGTQLERISYQKYTITTLATNGKRSVLIRPDKVSDLETGEKLLTPKEQEGWMFETDRFMTALSPDGNSLVIWAHDHGKESEVRWYDLKWKKLMAARQMDAREYAFLPDGRLVSAGNEVLVWKAVK